MWRRCIDAHREHSRTLKRCICHGMFVHRECLERTMVVNREPESICLFAGINPGEKTYIIAKDQHTLSIWHELRLRKARCRRTHFGLLFFKYISRPLVACLWGFQCSKEHFLFSITLLGRKMRIPPISMCCRCHRPRREKSHSPNVEGQVEQPSGRGKQVR